LQLNREDFSVPSRFFCKLLSAKMKARFSASLRCSIRNVGTWVRPSRFAAATRPCPAMIAPDASIKTGLRNLKRFIERAICSI
jgi:hypothetical protein